MPNENPGAYNEARNRIKEKQEKEKESFEIRRKEEFESKKEKLYSKKHLDVFSLRRSIETGKSLNSLKEDIKKALDNGDITLDTYRDVIDTIEQEDNINIPTLSPSFVLDPRVFPFYESELSKFLDNQKLGKNIFFDF